MEAIVRGLSSLVKRKVIGNISNLSNSSEPRRVFSNSVIEYLKKTMNTNQVEFYKAILNISREKLLGDESFMSWLCPQLTSKSARLKTQIYDWMSNNFTSNQGRKHSLLKKEGKQDIQLLD